jgi:outer membrane receptor protein involved in Fe transport
MVGKQFLISGLAMVWMAGRAFSQAPTPPADDSQQGVKPGDATPDLSSMDLDSLLNMKVTTASKFAEKLSDAPSVMAVVSQDELQRFAGMTLSEILNRVAGLNTSSGWFQDRSTIAVEGDQSRLNSGHILLLINGRPVREILEGGISSDLLESFPVRILERIEVIKGPGSVLYGSDAFSGVINLITKKAEGTSVDVSSSGGPSGAEANSAEMLYDRGALNVVAAGQYHQMPVWDTRMGFLAGPLNSQTVQNASVRDDGAGAYLGVNYQGFRFMSSYTGLEEASFVAGVVGDTRWKRGFTDVGYDLDATSKWEMSFDFTYTRNILDDPYFPLVHRDSYSALFEWTNFYTFSEKDRITFGTLFEHIAGTELYLISPPVIAAQGSREQGGIYAQYEHQLTGNLKLIGGLQANKIGAIDPNVVPRGGILWNLSPNVTLKALYGGAFRAPSLDETLLNSPLKGNPSLVPETVGTLDIQASYQSNRAQVAVAYFHSRQDKVIFLVGRTYPLTYENLAAPATFQGVDSEGKYHLTKGWFLMGGALYQTNQDSAVQPLSPIPSFSAKAGLSYQAGKTADISMFDAYEGHVPGYSDALNPRPDAFHSVNAHLRFDLTKRWIKNDQRGLAAIFYGDNLTNTPVWLPQWGSTAGLNTMPVNRGRTLFVGIEVWQKGE